MAGKIFPKHITTLAFIDLERKHVVAKIVLSRPIIVCKFLDIVIMHYFNDKPCFLMLIFCTLYATSEQN